MPFVVGCLALLTPRFAIVLVVIFSDYIGRAYETTLWPFLGFLFLPLTTLAYAWAINANGTVEGIYLVVVVVAVEIALRTLRMPTSVGVTVTLLLALLVGFEAATLRAFTYRRRKWSNVGVIVGDDREAAERRFYDLWVAHGAMPTATAIEMPAARP